MGGLKTPPFSGFPVLDTRTETGAMLLRLGHLKLDKKRWTLPQRLQRVRGPAHAVTLNLRLPGPSGMSFQGLLSLLPRLQEASRPHAGD